MDGYGVGWLVVVTVVWLLAAMVATVMLLAYLMSDQGLELNLHGWRRVVYLAVAWSTVFVIPVGLAVAAQAAGFTPWLWVLYLLPYEILALWTVYVLVLSLIYGRKKP
jgi:hypothetical protein